MFQVKSYLKVVWCNVKLSGGVCILYECRRHTAGDSNRCHVFLENVVAVSVLLIFAK